MKEELARFLSDIWGTGGKVFLAYKKSYNPPKFEVPRAKNWPEDSEKIIDFILMVSAKKKDIYFAPAIYKEDAQSKESINTLYMNCLWVDFDGNVKEGLSLLAAHGLPAPTYRVQTSGEGHEHWYWILNEPLPASEFELVNQRLTYALHADKSGWDAAQVLRPPFTSNYKPEYNKPMAVDIVQYTAELHSIEVFSKLPAVNASIRESIGTAVDKNSLPSIDTILASYKWDAKHLDIFKNPVDIKGTRDQSIMRLAYFCAEVGMTDDAMYVIIDDLTTRLNKFVGRHDRERRLAEIINNARQKHPYGASSEEQVEEDIQQVFTMNELLNAEFKLDWLVEGLLPSRTINFISAESGIGKSRFSLQFMEALATAGEFLEWKVPRRIKTMYLSLEMDRYMLKHFGEQLSHNKLYSEEDNENLIMVPVGNPISLVSEEGTRYIEYLLKTYNPEVLMIDALGSLTFDDIDGKEAKNIMTILKGFIRDYDTTFFIIHHNRKGDKAGTRTPPVLGDVYGNQYIVTDAALVLTLWAPDGQHRVELITLKTRARLSDKPIVLAGNKGFKFLIKDDNEIEEEEYIGEPGLFDKA